MLRFTVAVFLFPVLGALLLTGCGPDDAAPDSGGGQALVVDYPIEGSVFPPDFMPPTFLWHDDARGVNAWKLSVTFADGGEPVTAVSSGPPPPQGEIDPRTIGPTNEVYKGTPYQRSAHSWVPTRGLWEETQHRSTESPAVLTIEGFSKAKPGTMLTRGRVTFSTSTDPVGAPIFYRDVPLMPSKGEDGKISPLNKSALPLIAWRLKDVSRPDSKVILTGMPSCANCHSFSEDGNTLGMDIDGPRGDKGTYAIAPLSKATIIGDEEVITWNSFPDKPKGHKTIGFLSRISPDGSIALTTVNESIYITNFTDYKFLQVFYPTRGILAWYSKESGEMKALPGADDPEYVHCSPVWFPDGQEIVFSRAKAIDPKPPGLVKATYAGDPNELQIRYDLYRMPFNNGRGGTPVPIKGASYNGMSNTFPKVSPDGKWIVITRCKNGLLMRPDGRLWILPAKGGEAREMNCNTALMNSWHSFSPNGRWMVFSSKINTPCTQMFLTHIDEDGNDTPPILIENSTAANRAVNIPEFVNRDFDAFSSIEVPAVKHFRGLDEGLRLVNEGRLEEAIPVLERVLELNPDFSPALTALGYALLETGHVSKARQKLLRSIDINPQSSLAYINLGLTFLREGLTIDAAEQFEMATSLEPTARLAHHNLGLVRLEQGNLEAALESLEKASELEPKNADVRNALGCTLDRMGRRDEAIAEFRTALRYSPEHSLALTNLAGAVQDQGDSAEALVLLRKAVDADPRNSALRSRLFDLLLEQKLSAEALGHLEVMLKAAPEDQGLRLSLAWHLATLPDDSVRDGARAVRLAEGCRETEGERADILDVLAAAYAEAGRFPEAVKAASRALEIQETGAKTTMPGLADRLMEYQAGRPHRQ